MTANPTSGLFGSGLNLGSGRTLNIMGDETIGGTGPFQLYDKWRHARRFRRYLR